MALGLSSKMVLWVSTSKMGRSGLIVVIFAGMYWRCRGANVAGEWPWIGKTGARTGIFRTEWVDSQARQIGCRRRAREGSSKRSARVLGEGQAG